MSCIPEMICYNYGGIVAVAIPTVKGYIVMNPPSFYWIEFKRKCYQQGYTSNEIEMSIRNFIT